MSRTTVLNLILGIIALGLVATLVILETSDDAASTSTSTTPTSTTTTTTATVPATTSTTTTTTTTTSTTTTLLATTSTTSVPASTVPASTVPASTEVPIERFFVAVVVVNGSTAGERLDPVVQSLRDRGYGFVRGLGGAVLVQDTVLYALDESFIGEAEVVAADLGFAPGDVEIQLFDDAPPVSGVLDAKVIVYLGGSPLPEPPEPAGDADVETDASDG
ncbi:MAG: hypothetical protein ACE37B_07305 [Ilumatobacter sp.]|uniref:hypothetical protein n=1 Tax=Ilumatobacter sp. TaxID=1967498 RepID=UPI00391DA0B9